ncbi:immunity-related GTPases-like protein, partial [Trichophaea hybrida]
LHFAVSGQSCSGKSSLINALRGIKNRGPNAAKVGHTETTTSVARYPGGERFPRVAWYDIPGAGTREIPASQYFNQQGLFLFDFIILVYDGSFTEIDGEILEQCRGFEIPAFIVRSKSDQHILNVKEDEECDDDQARELYIEETRANLKSNLK